MLQKYDAEREEAKWKFDLERDEVQRKFIAAMWGVELKDNTKPKPSSSNGRKKTLTQQDLMRNYRK